MEADGKVVVADLEAGVGTLLRLGEGGADLAFIVAQPTAKSMEVAARAARISAGRQIPAVLVANRVTGDDDVALIRETVSTEVPYVVVPDDPAVAEADEEGVAPIDTAPESPGVRAIAGLVEHIVLASRG